MKNPLRNEEGSLMAAVVLIVVLVSLMGFMAIELSNTEVTTAGNEARYKQNIYNAEAAAIESAQRVEEASGADLRNPSTLNWLNRRGELPAENDLLDIDNWVDVHSQESNSSDGRFMAITEGIVPGSSLDMSHSQIQEFTLYGQARRQNGGLSTVQLGYRRAY